jgi:hypothetical protein
MSTDHQHMKTLEEQTPAAGENIASSNKASPSASSKMGRFSPLFFISIIGVVALAFALGIGLGLRGDGGTVKTPSPCGANTTGAGCTSSGSSDSGTTSSGSGDTDVFEKSCENLVEIQDKRIATVQRFFDLTPGLEAMRNLTIDQWLVEFASLLDFNFTQVVSETGTWSPRDYAIEYQLNALIENNGGFEFVSREIEAATIKNGFWTRTASNASWKSTRLMRPV